MCCSIILKFLAKISISFIESLIGSIVLIVKSLLTNSSIFSFKLVIDLDVFLEIAKAEIIPITIKITLINKKVIFTFKIAACSFFEENSTKVAKEVYQAQQDC